MIAIIMRGKSVPSINRNAKDELSLVSAGSGASSRLRVYAPFRLLVGDPCRPSNANYQLHTREA